MQKNALKKLLQSHKFDILLGTVLLLVALCLFLVFNKIKKSGSSVEVKVNNKIVGVYSLSKDGSYDIKSSFDGKLTLVIKDNKAYAVEANCPDHLCEKMGKISKVGESIICLPHQIFIKVVSEEEAEYDAVAK